MFTMGLLCGLVLMGLVAWAFTAWRSASALAQAQPQQSAEIGHSAPPEAVVSPEQEAGPSGGPVVSGRYWRTTRGLPAHKVVLGVPFYARPSWASYENILAAVPDAYQKDHVTYNGMDAWYNGVDTIKKKTRFAMQELGGVMIWEVTQDTADRSKSLLQAIGQALRGG